MLQQVPKRKPSETAAAGSYRQDGHHHHHHHHLHERILHDVSATQ